MFSLSLFCFLFITLKITMGLQLHVLISFIHNRLVLIGRSFMFYETVTTVCLGSMWKMSSRLHKLAAQTGRGGAVCMQSKWSLPDYMRHMYSFKRADRISFHRIAESYLPTNWFHAFQLSLWRMIAAQQVIEGQDSLQLSPTHKTNHIRSTLRSKTWDKR